MNKWYRYWIVGVGKTFWYLTRQLLIQVLTWQRMAGSQTCNLLIPSLMPSPLHYQVIVVIMQAWQFGCVCLVQWHYTYRIYYYVLSSLCMWLSCLVRIRQANCVKGIYWNMMEKDKLWHVVLPGVRKWDCPVKKSTHYRTMWCPVILSISKLALLAPCFIIFYDVETNGDLLIHCAVCYFRLFIFWFQHFLIFAEMCFCNDANCTYYVSHTLLYI